VIALLATFVALAERHARTLKVVEVLIDAGLQGRGLNAAVLQAYRVQIERGTEDIQRFQALLAQTKSLFTVH
jgi:hypothetical protein